MPVSRMNRDEFYAKVSPLDAEQLRKALRTLPGVTYRAIQVAPDLPQLTTPAMWRGFVVAYLSAPRK